MSSHVGAREAAERLGVTRATLYAYVSRGWIRSRPGPDQRVREYHLGDLEARRGEKSARRDPRRAAARALGESGLPVLDSAVTLIDAGKLYYRGRDAIVLSRRATFEQVCELLCEGPLDWSANGRSGLRPDHDGERFLPAAIAHLAARVDSDPGGYHLAPESVRRTGGRILRGLAGLVTGDFERDAPLARLLAQAWGTPRAAASLDAALILCADHELNASAFAARTAAATGASPYMAMIAALATLSGHRHGGATELVAQLLAEPGSPRAVVAGRLRSGAALPGFGHPLYPDGDPRGARLMELCRAGAPARRARAVAAVASELVGVKPTLDYGLVALANSHGWPASAPIALFALGRSAGWLAHCLEQYRVPGLIRPRARYVGPAPEAG